MWFGSSLSHYKWYWLKKKKQMILGSIPTTRAELEPRFLWWTWLHKDVRDLRGIDCNTPDCVNLYNLNACRTLVIGNPTLFGREKITIFIMIPRAFGVWMLWPWSSKGLQLYLFSSFIDDSLTSETTKNLFIIDFPRKMFCKNLSYCIVLNFHK